MTTLDVVSPKKESNEDRSAEAAAAAELVRLAKEQGLALTGPDGLLKLFTKNVLETALNEELTEHLGHEKHRPDPDRTSGNVRNGTRPKTVLTPSDRGGHDRGPSGSRRFFRTADREETTTPPERGRGSRVVVVRQRPHDR